jgi:hypothetical protein
MEIISNVIIIHLKGGIIMNEIEVLNFDYSKLDKKISVYLKQKETNIRRILGETIKELGKELKEAQEILAGSNQYDGVFEKWYTSMGFTKRTVYNYINYFNFLVVQPLHKQNLVETLPKKLVYEVAKPTANPDLKKRVLKGEITSLKKYREMKAELNINSKKLEESEMQIQKLRDLLHEESNKKPKVIEIEKKIIVEKKVHDDEMLGKLTKDIAELELNQVFLETENSFLKNENEKFKETFSSLDEIRIKTKYDENGNPFSSINSIWKYIHSMEKILEDLAVMQFCKDFEGMNLEDVIVTEINSLLKKIDEAIRSVRDKLPKKDGRYRKMMDEEIIVVEENDCG